MIEAALPEIPGESWNSDESYIEGQHFATVFSTSTFLTIFNSYFIFHNTTTNTSQQIQYNEWRKEGRVENWLRGKRKNLQ